MDAPESEKHSVSIPSRGFWFFEDMLTSAHYAVLEYLFQSPRGDFGFLNLCKIGNNEQHQLAFQSPRGDFGFLKRVPERECWEDWH